MCVCVCVEMTSTIHFVICNLNIFFLFFFRRLLTVAIEHRYYVGGHFFYALSLFFSLSFPLNFILISLNNTLKVILDYFTLLQIHILKVVVVEIELNWTSSSGFFSIHFSLFWKILRFFSLPLEFNFITTLEYLKLKNLYQLLEPWAAPLKTRLSKEVVHRKYQRQFKKKSAHRIWCAVTIELNCQLRKFYSNINLTFEMAVIELCHYVWIVLNTFETKMRIFSITFSIQWGFFYWNALLYFTFASGFETMQISVYMRWKNGRWMSMALPNSDYLHQWLTKKTIFALMLCVRFKSG